VAEVPATGLLFAVRNVCEVKEVVEHRERLTQPQDWATTATEWEHDGYGNVLLESDLGVTAMGGKACPACEGDGYTGTPCGPKCLGDEAYKRTEFAGPADNDNRWILRKQVREQKFGVANAQGEPANELYSETVFYYDGTEFQGLPEGKVTHGTPTRITTRKDGTGAVVTQSRNRVDAHGNVVEAIDPLGEVDGTTHRRLYTMDDEGLKLVEVEILNEDAQGAYSLRQEVKYDALWGKPIEATVWRKVVDGTAVDPANSSYYTYDEFGRLTAIVRPGDSLAKPTEEFEYDLANPVSAVATRKRSVSGGALDLESVKCVDGRGRDTQIRVKVAEGNWQVKGFSIFNAHGSERRTNYPYLATTGDCANEVPQGTLKQQYRYDAMGRKLELFLPQVGDETADAVVRTVLGPMDRLEYDLNDTEAGGPHFDTPTRVVRNGLDQIIRVERLDKPAGTPLVHQIRYDEIGHIAAITDPIGATLVQQHDLLGRVVKSVHPDAGTTLYEFDDAGNLVRTEDGRGKVVRSQFDGLNRIVARWDEEDPTGSRISWIYDRPVTCPAEQCTNTAARTAEISFTVAGQPAGERLGYDSRGQQIWRQLLLQGHAFTSTTTHDNAGRITSVTHPSGLVINTQLDGADRAMKVPGYVDQFQYQPDGVVGTILAANGVQTIRTFDERKRLESITVTAPDDSLVIAHSLTLDPAGNILEVADDRGEEDVPQGGGRFTYDSLYRLLEAKLDPSRPAHAETLSYTYDQGDRVLSSTSDLGGDSVAHVGTLSYGVGAGPHAVTKAGDLDFTYDGAGLASSRGTVDYKWDAFGRMVAASEGSNTLARFSYGEANDRLVKDEDGHQTLYLAADFEVRDGTAVTYVEIGQDRLARVEEPAFAATALSDLAPASGTDLALVSAPDGIITAADAWLAAAAKAGSLGFTDEAPLDSPTVLLNASVNRMLGGLDSKVTWLHADHRGDLVAETDGSGKVTSRTEFYPYGMERSAQGKGDPHGFTGKETDESTGLTYFGARYLDPWTGRWTAPDPSFLVASQITETNLAEMTGAYLYGGDNPLTMVDKTGHNFNPAHGIYYFKSSAMKKTVAKLMQGDLRPSLGFMTAFGLRPDAPISKKLAWKMVKTANSIMKNDHVTVDAFRPGGSTASIKEFSNSILEIQQSPIYSKVAYEQGRNRDLAKFGIQSAVLGGALDTKINRDIMVGEGSFQGPVKQNEKFVGTSNVPVATEWVHLLSNIGGQLPRQSLEPQKKPGLWSRIKAKIGGGG
jgi:RHS repeat-associated protein